MVRHMVRHISRPALIIEAEPNEKFASVRRTKKINITSVVDRSRQKKSKQFHLHQDEK